MIFWLLFLLTFKHFVADFVIQSDYQVSQKGTYGASGGIVHALTHGVFTALILGLVLDAVQPAIMFGLLDSIVHYHIDYVKARWGSRDSNSKIYWYQLGLDQFCHYVFYIWLTWVLSVNLLSSSLQLKGMHL